MQRMLYFVVAFLNGDYMIEFIEESIVAASYKVRINYVTNKHRGGGSVHDFSDISVSEKNIESFLDLINKLKETLSSGNKVVPDDYYGDYILENETYSCTLNVPVAHCSFSSYFYRIDSIEAYLHEEHKIKKVKIK